MADISDAPVWFESLKWFIAAGMLAIAIVGPVIFGPIIEKLKGKSAVDHPQGDSTLALIGSTYAENRAIERLATAVERLCDILEDNAEVRRQQSQDARMKQFINDALDEIHKREQRNK